MLEKTERGQKKTIQRHMQHWTQDNERIETKQKIQDSTTN